MSKQYQKRERAQNYDASNAEDFRGVAQAMATLALNNQNGDIRRIIDLEAADHIQSPEDLSNGANTLSMVSDTLRHTSFFSRLEKVIADPTILETSLEAASWTALANNSGLRSTEWLRKCGTPAVLSGDDVRVANPNSGYLSYRDHQDFDVEGFDPKFDDVTQNIDIIANAMAVVPSEFESLFYPTIVTPAGAAVVAKVSVAQITAPTYRQTTGAAFNINRIPMVRALRDSTLLSDLVLHIVPVATDATNPSVLVPNSEIAGWNEKVEGQVVTTRPLKLGQWIDLIGVSTTPAMAAAGVLDSTDQLDKVIGLRDLFIRASFTDGTETIDFSFKASVKRQVGALLQNRQAGNDRVYITTASFACSFTEATAGVHVYTAGKTQADLNEMINQAIGQSVGGKFTVTFNADVSSEANIDTGNMRTSMNGISLREIASAEGRAVTASAGNTFSAMTINGWVPDARRTNSNLRTRGPVIDCQTAHRYVFAPFLGTAIISLNAVNAPENATAETLGFAQRVLNNNNAHKALLSLREMLQDSANVPISMAAIGSELIKPTYIKRTLDVRSKIRFIDSSQGAAALAEGIILSLRTLVNDLLNKSNYLAALEYMTGSNTGYEVIALTDTTIHNWLMVSGDPRTMGNGRNFNIAASLNSDITGRIFVSVRRANRTAEPHPLDFGCFIYSPPRTYSVQVSRGGGTVRENHTIPCNAHYNTGGILGELEIANISDLFPDPL